MTLSRALIGGPSVAEIGELDVTETTHGFVVGNLVYNNGTAWLKADASDADKSADAIVTEVADVNTFSYSNLAVLTLTTGEWDAVAGTTGGLTPGENYRLSELTAGELTEIGPAASGITQWILKAVSTTKGLVYFGDPQEIGVNGETVIQSTNGFRLTLETAVPVSTTDQTAKTTIYFTLYESDQIALYDGVEWAILSSAEVSLALGTLTSGKNYDVFAYDASGTLTLELSAAWTTDTARADAIVRQDGVWVKSGTTTRRYVGTFRTTATTTTEDSLVKRFVWNVDNRVWRDLEYVEAVGASWSYSTATYRQSRADVNRRVEVVTGLSEDAIDIRLSMNVLSSASLRYATAGIGIDSTTVNSATSYGGNANSGAWYPIYAHLLTVLDLGYHALNNLEWAYGNGSTITWNASNTTLVEKKTGLSGKVMA